MSGLNLFQNNTKTVPTGDSQIVRVDMQEIQIGGRKSALPAQQKNDATIVHVPNAGGGK